MLIILFLRRDGYSVFYDNVGIKVEICGDVAVALIFEEWNIISHTEQTVYIPQISTEIEGEVYADLFIVANDSGAYKI